MFQENSHHLVSIKAGLAERLFSSRQARERIIRIFEARCSEIPQTADAALVLGTSPHLYPDKFKKRVFTAVSLAREGKVPLVIFSGKKDQDADDFNQAIEAKRLAVMEFGLDEKKILTVGGGNTNENIVQASELLAVFPQKLNDIFVVSNNQHLIRAIPLADQAFGVIGIRAHPYPVPCEGKVDPDDPKVIEEIIKTILYNRTLNKNTHSVNAGIKTLIDGIADSYTQLTRSMPNGTETSFEDWKKEFMRESS